MTSWPYNWPGTQGLTYDEAVWVAQRAASAHQFPGQPPLPRQTRQEWCARMQASRAADEARYLHDCQQEINLAGLHRDVAAELRQAARDGHLHPAAGHVRSLRPPRAPRPPRITR